MRLLGRKVRSGQGKWLTIHSPAEREADLDLPNPLIRQQDLSLRHITTWLDRVEALGQLPPVVAQALTGRIQLETRVLELATVAEGLHRRLYPETMGYSKEVADRIREAVGAALAAQQPDADNVVGGLLSHLEEVGYGQRLRHLAERAETLVPGVSGRTGRWKDLVYAARNDFAHRLRSSWLSEGDVDRYLTVAMSLRWVLQTILLGEAGLSPDLLTERFSQHTPYRLFLTQAAVWQPKVYLAES